MTKEFDFKLENNDLIPFSEDFSKKKYSLKTREGIIIVFWCIILFLLPILYLIFQKTFILNLLFIWFFLLPAIIILQYKTVQYDLIHEYMSTFDCKLIYENMSAITIKIILDNNGVKEIFYNDHIKIDKQWTWQQIKTINNMQSNIILLVSNMKKIIIPKRIFNSEEELDETWTLIQECYKKVNGRKFD